jgi:hypothetical protein
MNFVNFTKVAEIPADPDEVTYSYQDPYYQPLGVYYRIAAHMDDGSIEYSPVARIMPDPISKPSLTVDFNTNLWRINLPPYWRNGNLTVYDLQGRTVYETELSKKPHIDLTRPVTPGIYFISIRGEAGFWSERLIR